MKTIWNLFIAFFRASNFSFGGGSAAIPLVQREVVEKYKWLKNDEFIKLVAVSNALPAPITTKLAGMIGFQVKGWPGAAAALAGAVLPTALVVIFLGGVIIQYAESPALSAMLKGVRPVVAVLLLQSAIQMGRDSFSGWLTWAFGITAFLVMLFLPFVHPAFLIVAAMFFGYFLFKPKGN